MRHRVVSGRVFPAFRLGFFARANLVLHPRVRLPTIQARIAPGTFLAI
jgi:hypothetical protein